MVQSSCRFSARGARPLRTALGAALILLLTTCGHKSPTAPGLSSPATPAGLKVTTPTDSSLTLTWSGVQGARSYELYRDSVQGGAFRTEAYTGPDTLFTDSTLAGGTTYYYKVRASNSAGQSPLSPVASGTTVPAAPANLTVTACTNSSFTLAWSSVRGGTGYDLYRDTTKDGAFETVAYTGPDTLFTDTALSVGKRYYYEVRASSAVGQSPPSAILAAVISFDAPANLKVTAPTASSLTLSWSGVAGATGYELHRDTARGGSFQTVAYAGPDTLFTDTALAVSTTYYYEVMATSATNKGVPSAVVSGTTIPLSVTLSPASASDTIGHTMQFLAHVAGTTDTTVGWYVNSVRGGNSGLGTIDSTGLYKAPESPPSPASVSVRAVSAADTSKSATATVTIIGATTQPMLVWTAFAPTESVQNTFFRALTVDKAGDPIAAGTVTSAGGNNPYATVFTTDSLGHVRWTYTSTANADARSLALAPDSMSVFLAGSSGNPSDSTVPSLFEVDSAGSEIHSGTCPNLRYQFWNLTRAGDHYDLLAPGGIATADLAGNLDCTNLIDGAPVDSMPTDSTPPWGIKELAPFGGDLYDAGTVPLDNQYWTNGSHVYVQQIDGSAQPVWHTSLDPLMGPPVSDNGPMRLTVANEAGGRAIYLVVGQFDDSISGNLDWARYRTVKFDAAGNILWSRLWNGDNTPESDEAYPYALIPDPHGGVIFAGMGSENGSEAWTCNIASYTSDGSLRWAVAPAWNVGGDSNLCSAAALSPDGRFLYVAGETGPEFNAPQHMFIAKFALPPG